MDQKEWVQYLPGSLGCPIVLNNVNVLVRSLIIVSVSLNLDVLVILTLGAQSV